MADTQTTQGAVLDTPLAEKKPTTASEVPDTLPANFNFKTGKAESTVPNTLPAESDVPDTLPADFKFNSSTQPKTAQSKATQPKVAPAVSPERQALMHPEMAPGQLPSGATGPNTDSLIRRQPSSYTAQALTRTPSTSPTNTPAMAPTAIKGANDIAAGMGEKGSAVGRQVAATSVANMRGPSYVPSNVNATATPQQVTEEFRKNQPVATGVAEAVGGAVGGTVADPRQLALLVALPEANPVIQRLASTAFTAYMAPEVAKGTKELISNWGNMSPEQRSEAITQLGIGGVFTALTAGHMLGVEHLNPMKMPGDIKANTIDKVVKPALAPIKEVATRVGEMGDQYYHTKKVAEAQTALQLAQKEAAKHYQYSMDQGEKLPAEFQKPIDKAKKALEEAEKHRDITNQGIETRKNPPKPEIPTAQVEAMPQPGPKKPALPKVAERPTVSPAHATTTIPQEPVGRPVMPTGQMRLPGGEPVGKPLQLTEGTPEGPKVPEGGLPKLAPTPEPAKPVVTDEAALRALEAKKGEVVENPQKKVHGLLKEALKTDKNNPNFPAAKVEEEPAYEGEERREAPRPATMSPTEIENAMKNRKPVHTPFDVTEGAMETIKRDEAMPKHPAEEAAAKPVLPKEEPTGYAAKKEEVVPAGAEGREPVKSAAEYHPAVQEQVTALPDEKLRQLAKAHGLNPDEYDFKARDAHRHRVERDQLAAEITAQMGDDEKINIGRNAEKLEHNPDMASKTKAQRAESLFPRLRGPVDEFGNPTVRGGAPETVGTEKAAKSDTEHFANAKKELGDKASISDVAKRAQELKDTHTQLAAHEANGGSTFSSKGKDLNGTDNYSVGSYPDRTEQVDKLTPERLEEFKKKNDDVLSKEGHAVGTWKDPDTGKAVLDVARIYTDRGEAIAAGKAANQKSIYHLGGEGEIKTGGTGEGPVAGTKAKPDFDMIKDADGKPDRLEITHNGEPMGHLKIEEQVPGTWTIKDAAVKPGEQGKGFGKAAHLQAFDEALKAGAKTVESDVSNSSKENGVWESIKKDYPEAVTEENGQYSIDLDKMQEKRLPTVSGGSPSAGAAKAKVPEFDVLSEEHLTPEEKAGLSKSAVAKRNYADNMAKLPPLQEWVDAAKGGEGAKNWYTRSRQGFKALHEAMPKYFEPGDGERWANFVASLSPRQMVHKNLAEAIHAWTQWVDDGRPMDDKAMEKSLREAIAAAPDTKIPNAMKALQGKEMWPDLTKNRNFKVPSFGKNLSPAENADVLKKYMNFTTNDGWQALFGGLDEKTVSNPTSYHPLSAMTRAAAKELGWTAEQAQAAIWSFTQALKERGEVDPHYVREYSEDFADILSANEGIRRQLKELGVDLGQLDEKLKAVEPKQEITPGASRTVGHSTARLTERIEAARGKGSIPEPKQQKTFSFKEPPAIEGRSRIKDESTSFNPEEFESEEDKLKKLGQKKKPGLKKM